MRKLWTYLVAGCLALLAGPAARLEGGTSTDGFNFATFARGASHPRYGTSGTSDNFKTLRPGQKFDFFSYTGTCSCPGWRTDCTITFNGAITFRDADYSYYFTRREVSEGQVILGADGLGGIFLVMPFEVKPIDQLGGESEVRVSAHLVVTSPQGVTCTDDIEYAVPILGVPPGVGVDAVTPRPGYARAGDEVEWRVRANPGDLVSKMTVENPLPDRKIGTLVPGSATPQAQVQGGKLVWNFNDVDKPQSMSFKVKLADQLPPKLKEISDTATMRLSTGKSKSATKKVPLARATLVAGSVKDAIVEFPKRNSVLLRPVKAAKGAKSPILARLLKKGDGSEVDSKEVDGKGNYALDAVDSGDFEVRIEADADHYLVGANEVDPGGVRLVQARDVTVPTAQENPKGEAVEVDPILFPLSLTNDIAQRLYRLNNLSPKLAGFIPLPTTLGTGSIPATMDGLAGDLSQRFEKIYDGTGTRDGWNAAIRLDAVLSIVEQRFNDNAKLADYFSKSVALFVTIEVMKKLGPPIVDRWKIKNGVDPDAFVPASMKSRTVEAVKIATLAYGVGYLLPKLLNQTKLKSEEKSLIIEAVAKAVRFGLNTMVASQNDQDIVFEGIFQTLRLGLFAGFYEGFFVRQVNQQLDRVAGLFASRTYAEDTNATLAWLESYDAKVGDRSKENSGVAADALTKLSLFVRGIDGILFKSQQAMGYSKKEFVSKTLKGQTFSLLKFLEKPKTAATLSAFALAVTAPLAEQAFLYQDIEVEVGAAFSGPSGLGPPDPPGEGLATFLGNGVLKEIDLIFHAISSPAFKGGTPAPAPLIAEAQAYDDALDGIEQVLKTNDDTAYPAARTTLLTAHDALFTRLRSAAEQAVVVLNADPTGEDVLVGVQGWRYETGNSVSLLYTYLEVWAQEPTKGNASAAAGELRSLRTTLAGLSSSIAGAEAALAKRQVPAVLVVSGGPDGGTLAPGAHVTFTFTVRNLGGAASAAATARMETSDTLTLTSAAEVQVPVLAPGASAQISYDVTAASARRAASYVLQVRQPDGSTSPEQGQVFIEP